MQAFLNALFAFFVLPYLLVVIPIFILPGKWTKHDISHGIRVTLFCHVATITSLVTPFGILPILYWILWYPYSLIKAAGRPVLHQPAKAPDLDKILSISERDDFDWNKELQLGTGISVPLEERAAHMYLVGRSGAGKSSAMRFWFGQDIEIGRGCAVMDPHGDLIKDYLASLAQNFYLKARENYKKDSEDPEKIEEIIRDLDEEKLLQRIILLDPTEPDWAVGFNPLEPIEGLDPEDQAEALTNSILKVWQYEVIDAPVMNDMLYNISFTLIKSRYTLAEAGLFLNNESVRRYMLGYVNDRDVLNFWNQYPRQLKVQPTRFESSANKIRTLTRSKKIRAIIGQKKGRFSFRDVMDEGKVILFRLAKGEMGEGSASILGGFLMTHFNFAASSRAKIPESQREPFYFYIDEFQNFAGGKFGDIFREFRKYKVRYILAHQDFAQIDMIDKSLRAGILGNANIKICFSLKNREDALIMAYNIFTLTGILPERIEQREDRFSIAGRMIPTSRDEIKYARLSDEAEHYAGKIANLPDRQFMVKLNNWDQPDSDATVEMPKIDYDNPYLDLYDRTIKNIIQRGCARNKEEVLKEIDERSVKLLDPSQKAEDDADKGFDR